MSIFDEEEKVITIELLIDEMERAEELLNSWNAAWFENRDEYENEDYYTIEWYGINTKKATRRIVFKGNGDVSLEKNNKGRKKINYKANYNVVIKNFDLSLETITPEGNKSKRECVDVSLKDNILTERLNDIKIITDLNTGKKKISIVKDYDKMYLHNNMPAVNFEANLDQDGKITSANAVVTLHKRNGKVNGSYRFDVNKSKGLRANYYTRKGKKIDLTTNPLLLETANYLLASKIQDDEMIVRDFTNATQNSINNNITDRVINFDYSDFSAESIKNTEDKIRSTISSIKGEIPLKILSDNLDYYLKTVKNMNNNLGKQKVLTINNLLES